MSAFSDYTLVLGVDRNHIEHFKLVWPTWCRHKISMVNHPLVIFYDRQMDFRELDPVIQMVDAHPDLMVRPWPDDGVEFVGDTNSRWHHPQRVKMLSGFVHIPARTVRTDYWLKLDLDVIATDLDNWVNPRWFDNQPAIVGHPWGYTKPADQMLLLDQWVERHRSRILPSFVQNGPLNLSPKPGSTLVSHDRIISWCAFFNTDFTIAAAQAAEMTCGPCRLPVPSQDGYLWYMAKRGGYGIRRIRMKELGWSHQSRLDRIRDIVELEESAPWQAPWPNEAVGR